MKFKNVKSVLLLAFIMLMTGCQNRDWEFDDFDYTAVYFPWTYPVRTLILGDCDDYDNTNDRNHRFVISAKMGGVYQNQQNVQVDYIIDPTLVENLNFGESGLPVKMLPSEYYTLSNSNTMIIPKGSYSGGVTVQLTDAFFEDPDACTTNYVLPLRIVSASVDSVLRGAADESIANPDPRIASHWKTVPMDFTIFGIKYINPYHGNYLLRGKTTASDNAGQVASYGYGQYEYVEEGLVTPLTTKSLTTVEYTSQIQVAAGTSPGKYEVVVSVDPETNNVTVAQKDGTAFNVTGTGKYVKDGQVWGGKTRDAFYLDLNIDANGVTYHAADTLVFRDNMVKLEEFTPEVVTP